MKRKKRKCKACGKETTMPFHTCDRSKLVKKNDGMISACKCHTKKRCPIHSKLYK
jgi:hypothetical protein